MKKAILIIFLNLSCLTMVISQSISDTLKHKHYFSNTLEFNLGSYHYSKGEQNDTTANALLGINTYYNYHFNSKLMIGLGVGIDFYYFKASAPILANICYYPFTNKKFINPFISAQAGYSIGLTGRDDFEGNIENISIGGSFKLCKNKYINLSVGYRWQYCETPCCNEVARTANTLILKLGTTF